MPIPKEGDTTNNGAGANQDGDQDNTGKDKGTDSKTFSQDEVNDIVSKRINEVKTKNEETIAAKIQEAQAEWERKQKLSDEERLSEARKAKDEELANKERDIALRENRADAREVLQEKSIPTELVDWVVDVDADTTKKNIEDLEKVWNKSVEAGVEAKLKGSTPTDKSKSSSTQKPTGKATMSF
jgi:crotonobetainyl-CoA:carnitine CoA-transferase CaiB-like acyl-CoA transferase